MSELSPNLFQLEQVLSLANKAQILTCEVTSCRQLGVAIVPRTSGGHSPLVSLSLGKGGQVKTCWISWFSDPLLAPLALCFSTQDDLLLIGTCSGLLAVVPVKALLSPDQPSHGNKKVRIVRAQDEVEMARRAMPNAICWWATSEGKALAIIGTNHGFVIIVDLVDGKEIGHVNVSDKSIVRIEQVSDDTNDNTFIFITDSSGKQWRQLVEQRSSGYAWCGANEVASNPKTPTLEKAAMAGSLSSQISDLEPSSNEDYLPTRSRLAGLKQMSVASIASLRLRLSESRKIFDKKICSGQPVGGQNGTNLVSAPSSNQSAALPEPLGAKVGDTQLQVQTNVKGQKVISGLFRDTAILTMHNHELEVLPQAAFKLPKQTETVLIMDKVMIVKTNKSAIKVISSHHSEISLDKPREDPILQSFLLANDEVVLKFYKVVSSSDGSSAHSSSSSTPSDNSSTSEAASSAPSHGLITDPCVKLATDVGHKVNEAKSRGQALFAPVLVVTTKAVYILRLDQDPVSAFLALTTSGLVKEAEKIAACFSLEAKSLFELAADIKLTKKDFSGAISLYRQSGCKHLKTVLKFAASGRVTELLSYLNVLFKTSNLEASPSDRIHLSNLALMAYFQMALASEPSMVDDLRLRVQSYLDSNPWYDECLSVRLAAETREWGLLGHLALTRGLYADMLVAIAAAFAQLLSLETDNVKDLQDSMAKVLAEMAASERKGLLECLVHQRDNLANCVAFPALGEQIVRIVIGLLPMLQEHDLEAVVEQCRPDRPELWPILWHLRDGRESNEFGLMLLNFYITVQLLWLKKTSSSLMRCDPSLVKAVADTGEIVKLPKKASSANGNLLAAGYAHVLLVRPKSGVILAWGASAGGVLGLPANSVTSATRFSPPKAVEFFSGLLRGGQQRIVVVAVKCGKLHSLALTNCGLYAWGSSKLGQLGLGRSVVMAKKPTLVRTLAKAAIVGISAGSYHSAALDDEGRAWTWGWGVHGQLGHNSIENECEPQRLALRGKVRQIECGYAHTLALTVTGQVWSFGCGLFGQLGIGETKKSTVPTLVASLAGDIHQISCGYFHNLAFDRSGQRLYMWGCNPQVLRLEAQQKKKNKLISDEVNAFAENEPAPAAEAEPSHLHPTLVSSVAGLFTVKKVACGNQHSLILTDTGSVLAFGRNLDGQLGIGSRKEAKLPTLVSALQDEAIMEIACGGDYSLALSEAGSVFVWGNNGSGQHGVPPMEDGPGGGNWEGKVLYMKSTKRIIRLQHSLQNSCDVPKPVAGINAGVYSNEGMSQEQVSARASSAIEQNAQLVGFFAAYDQYLDRPDFRLHLTLELFAKSLEAKKLVRKCLISDNPLAAAKLSLMSGQLMQAFDFTLQAFVRSGHLGGEAIFEAFIFYLHYPNPLLGEDEAKMEVKRQLLERLIACWQDQKFSFVLLEQLFIQNFDAILLQVLVLTLFCPNNERQVNAGPVIDGESFGPKLVDLFTPEFCLRVGDSLVKSLKSEEDAAYFAPAAVKDWLQIQRRKEETLTSLMTGLNSL